MSSSEPPTVEPPRRSVRRPIGPDDIVASGLCIGCGACVTYGSAGEEMQLDQYGQFKPHGSQDWRVDAQDFERLCPFSPLAPNEDELADERFADASHMDRRIGRFEAAYVGHVTENGFRANGSSGGLVSWVAVELLRTGFVDGIVHAAPTNGGGPTEGYFKYRISRSEREIRAGAKSRYHPVELSEVIAEMRARPGRYAVVGIPCMIKALHLAGRVDPLLAARVAVTLGLFCGHMKSLRLVESFAWQMDVRPGTVRGVDYRSKRTDQPANWYVAELTLADGGRRRRHWWDMADGDWGAGYFQNSACDFCDDVVAETADISFGDAWVEPYSSDGRGTNVVIVRTAQLNALLRTGMADGRLELGEVDADFVARTQAAGLRHRREGLAYRLRRFRGPVRPRKRVGAGDKSLSARRKLIYAMRQQIGRWSHRVFRLARLVRWPGLYLGWARAALSLYHGLAYGRGWLGSLLDRLGWSGIEGRDP